MSLVTGPHTEYSAQTFSDLHHAGEEINAREFYDCTFIDCVFVEAVFSACRFVDCTFQACDLSLAQMPDSAFRSTTFKASKMIGINWTVAAWGAKGGFLNSIDFIDSTLNYSTFIGLSLPGTKIKRCVAKDVDFADANFSRADFRHTNLTDSRFLHTDLTEADFTGASGYAIAANLNTLKQTKFSLPEAMSLLYSLDIVLTDPDA